MPRDIRSIEHMKKDKKKKYIYISEHRPSSTMVHYDLPIDTKEGMLSKKIQCTMEKLH